MRADFGESLVAMKKTCQQHWLRPAPDMGGKGKISLPLLAAIAAADEGLCLVQAAFRRAKYYAP